MEQTTITQFLYNIIIIAKPIIITDNQWWYFTFKNKPTTTKQT